MCAFELTAEAGRCGTVQLGLFAPQTPEPSRLDVTLARLRAMVGDDRVGSPVLEDTHRPGSFRMEEFANETAERKREPGVPRMALRRVRPAMPVRVIQREARPAEFRDRENRFAVTAAYGPWKSERMLVVGRQLGSGRVGRAGASAMTGRRWRACWFAIEPAMNGGWRRSMTSLVVPNDHSPGTPTCHPNDAYR